MASGIKFLTSSPPGLGTTTLYTVPAGISYAVVHLRSSASLVGAGGGGLQITINDEPFYAMVTGDPFTGALDVALILSPGDYIKYTNSAGFASPQGEIIISSHEVP